MKIDAHQHFWRYDPVRDGWITDEMAALQRDFLPDELAIELRANGIDASIAVQADQSEAETVFLLELASRRERVAGVVGWIDFLSPRLPERLKFFSRFEKLCGFRHVAQAEPDDGFLARGDFVAGLRQLQGSRFTYDILIYARQLPAALELVSRLPEQRFVIDHLAKPEIKNRRVSPWAKQIQQIAKNRNVHCKLSGLVTEADWHRWKADEFRAYLDIVFEAFGVERLMFGSDRPVCVVAASYSQVVQIIDDYVKGYSAAEREKVFGGNAANFYGLRKGSMVAAQNTKRAT
jgi:L-fuconolactonase